MRPRHIRRLAPIACLAVSLAGCPAAGASYTPPVAPAEDVRAQAEAMNQFGVELYRAAGKTPGDVFLSPPSVGAALAMAWAGARGATAEQLAKALHQTLPAERAHPALGAALGAGRTSADPVFAVANRLWGAPDDLLPAYLVLNRDAYGAEVGQVDFRGDAEGARREINDWVAQETRDRIKDLLAKGAVDDSTRLVLTNAVYFKGAWEDAFQPVRTLDRPFTLGTGEQVQVPLMHRELTARYFEGEGFALAELPYRGERFAMLVIVPATHDGLPALEAGLSAEALATWLGAARRREIDVAVPRFKIEDDLDLKPLLEDLGVKDLFQSGAADLSGVNGARDLFVSTAVHKAFVDVNEEGTEAAAATGMAMAAGCALPEPRPELRADRPFLFMIRDTQTGLVWFMGRETDPRS